MLQINHLFNFTFTIHYAIFITFVTFFVVSFTTSGHAEKCVDISLAVEMLAMATMPDAYDVAGKYQRLFFLDSLYYQKVLYGLYLLT